MDFEKVSDQQINSVLEGYLLALMYKDEEDKPMACIKRCLAGNMKGTKDHCNSWADMGPLIVEYKLSVKWLDGCGRWGVDEALENQFGVYSPYSDNPLRAAAICLIKKLEAEND